MSTRNAARCLRASPPYSRARVLDRIPIRFEHLPPLRVVAGLVPATSIALAPCLEVRIGVGSIDWLRSPSLRTGRADLPHPALQSVVLPARGLAGHDVGLLQAKQPKRGKVGIGPARLVGPICFGTPFPMASFAQDASQPAAHKAVFHAECRTVAVLEVFIPAPQRPVHVGDDLGHAVPRGPLGLCPDRIPELLAALLARPALAGLEVVAEKVKAVLAFVDQPRLGRVQRQAGLRRPLLHHSQGRRRVLLASTHHHKVVRVAHHLEAPLSHQLVTFSASPPRGESRGRARTWCGKRRPKVDLPARWLRSRNGAGSTGIGLHANSTPGCLRYSMVTMPTMASRGTIGDYRNIATKS